MALPEFWIDADEVTNRQFKAFVDAGGYQKREYWTQPFVKDGRTLSWEEAMARVPRRDRPARPGDLGGRHVPDGQRRLAGERRELVRGRGVRRTSPASTLPTIYHWYRAAGRVGIFSDVLQVQQLRRARAAAGRRRRAASGRSAPHDMAGNVKEWVWNESSGGRRFVLGGAWFEARARSSTTKTRACRSTRDAGFGFRCMLQRAPLERAADPADRHAGARPGDADAGRRRGVPGLSAALRLRPAPARQPRRRARREPARLDRRARVVHRRLRQTSACR